MHTALKQAREDEALRSLARDVAEMGPRLARVEAQNAEILELLRGQQQRGHVAPAPSPNARGGR
jgi:hypothetical protein